MADIARRDRDVGRSQLLVSPRPAGEAVIRVIPRDDFTLELWFDNGEHRMFDARQYLSRGVFTRLQDVAMFKQAFVALGTVCWPDDIDIAPETLYDRSQPVAP